MKRSKGGLGRPSPFRAKPICAGRHHSGILRLNPGVPERKESF
jgi:hypothetical protein